MRRALPAIWLAAAALAEEPGGSAAVRVIDSITGQPVDGAAVTLMTPMAFPPVKPPTMRSARPDGGKYLVENVPPGTYQVHIKKLGYVDGGYGNQRIPTVSIAAGGPPVEVTVAIPPTATLEGAVRGEDGEPLPGVRVYAQAEGQSALFATSDAGGAYKIEYLPAGEYRLFLSIPAEIVKKSVRVDPDGARRLGYPPALFHPGVERAEEASPLFLSPGATTGSDLRVRRFPVVELSGRVLDAASRTPLTGEVELDSRTLNEVSARRPLDSGGKFRFPYARPGAHRLLIYRGGGALPYVAPVTVGSAATAGVEILAPAPVTVSGRMSAQGMIALSRGTGARAETASRPNGSFLLSGITPGPLSLTVTAADGGYARRVRIDGRDTPRRGMSFDFVLGEGGAEIDIEISKETGAISGRVAGEKGDPVAQARVKAVSDGWARFTSSDAAGLFRFENLPPGEYEVSACAGKSEKVRVDAGSTAGSTPRACGDRP